ncbi:hypothetical protein [uncultured Gammaproteobacteria bacterium]|nr:hypothetical protein [uncultured Gammaproteobacteria bacterium]
MITINKLFILLVTIVSLSTYANLVTNLEGEAKVNNGYLSYITPLALPQGINKLSPNLSINYTQGSGSSPLGLGFKLSGLPSVSRCAKTEKIDGIEHGVLLNEEDAYCLEGIRLIKISDNKYRLINNSNIKATLSNNAWTVYYPNGVNKKFTSANNYNNKILNWNLVTTKDKFNNTIDYNYTVDNNIYYVNTISYNNHKVVFNYKNSPHQYIDYRFGVKHQHNKLLDNIAIHTNNNLFKTYKLNYQTATTYSRLNEIILCDGVNVCTKPLTFGYKQLESNNDPDISDIIAEDSALDTVEDDDDIVNADEIKYEKIIANADEVLNYGVADFNNDGNNDVCYLDNTGLNCALGDGSGKFGGFSKWTNALSDSNWHKLEHSANLSFIDVNHDGWTDYCAVDDKGVWCGLNSKDNSFVSDKYWSTIANVEDALRFIDINKDNLIDLCYFGDDGIHCANNNGSEFGSKYQHSSLVFDIEINDTKIPQPQFLDTNGDNILDICGFKNKAYQCAIGYKDSDNNFVYKNSVNFINDLNLQDYSDKQLERFNNSFKLADLNNDGLVDLCYRGKDSLEYNCHLNTGNNYANKSTWLTLPSEMAYTDNGFADNYDNAIHFSDENADGLSDFCTIIANKRWCYNNINNGFSQSASKTLLDVDLSAINKTTSGYTRPLKKLFGLKTTFHTLIVNSRYGPFKTVIDLNNDGWNDFCYRSYGGLNCVYEEKQPIALLSKVTNSFGLSTNINYEKLNNVNYTSSASNHPIISTTPQLNLVSSIVVDTPTGETNQVNYHYSGYKYHLDDGSLGFESITVTNPSKNTVITTTYEQDKDDLIGSIVESNTTVDGVLAYKKQNEYQLSQPYSNVKNIQITKTTETFYENNILTKKIINEYSNYNQYNQAQKIVESKSNNFDQSLVTTSIGQYTQDTKNWLLNLPTKLEVTHARDGKTTTRETTYTYSDGNLIRQTIQPNFNLALTTNYQYNAQGLVNKTTNTDKNGNTKTTFRTYDSFGKVTSATNTLGQTAYNTYDSQCSFVNQSTAISGLKTKFTYDSLCRIKTKTLATGEVITYTYEWSDGVELGNDYQGLGLNFKDSSIYSVLVSSNTGSWHKTYYNAIGNKVREVALIDNDKHSITDIVYDKHGNIKAQSLPYFEGLFAGGNVAWSVYEYDNKNRIIQVKTPNEHGKYININTTYSANTITNNNQGQITKTTQDISGNDKSIVKNNQQTISYTYDAIGNLTRTDKDNSIITLEYDELGNKTKSIDPAMGIWSYVYNGFGELTQQTDSKGQITSIEYDKLGRIVKKTLAGQVSTWVYDDKGRLSSESKIIGGTQIVGKSYSYDSLSRLNEVTLSIIINNNTQDFTTKYEYDESSRIKTITYPDGFTEHKDYTLSGGAKKVSVPKNDVWDYDYLSLEKSLAKTAIRITELNKEAEELESKAQEYLAEAAKYEHYAENYQRTSDSYEDYANRLDYYSNKYYQYYQNHQRLASSYRAKANYYYRKFGNVTLSYVKTVNGRHYYRNTDCTNKNWKGSCRRQNNYNAYIPTWMVQDEDTCGNGTTTSGWKGRVICYAGPGRKINVSKTYNKQADYYQRTANRYKGYSEHYADRSKYYQQRSDEIQQQADEALETANNYKQQASEQTTQLNKIMNELEDQKNTQQELQTVLNNRLNGTIVALWTAISYDAYNKPKSILYGNGSLTRNIYSPHNNNLTSIEIGRGGDLINNMSYRYDKHNNITSIVNSITNETHNYSYDDMDRITNWQYSNNSYSTQKDYRYDIQNNLTFKTGAGNMTYNTANQLTSRIDNNTLTHTYQYDANGNQTQSTGNNARIIEYTPFNKTKKLTTQTTNGTEVNETTYDANNNRIIQKAYHDTSTGTHPNKITYHINKGYTVIHTTDNQNNEVIIHRHNIFVNGKVVATYDKALVNNVKAVDQVAYMHTDALGNIVTVTGNNGEIRLRQATSPFGETITQGLVDNTATGHFQKDDLRGFTGHEQLPRHNIINMNARLYDPLTARFLSADSLIPNSKDPLAYNRYIYVRNNPLKYTDPTGHWWQLAVAAVMMVISATTDDPAIAKVTAIAGMLLMGDALGGAGLSAAESGAVIGFTQGTLNSANLGEGVKQGVISGITAAAISEVAHGGENNASEFTTTEQLALQGLVGGISTELRGGKFQDGFVSAIISKGVDLGLEGQQLDFYTQGAITMIAGGLASKAGGGSFEDGAVQAGMVFLYNFNKILTAEDAEQAANANARALELVFGSNAAPIKIDGRTQTEVDAGQKALVTGMASMIGGGLIGKLSKDIITNPIVKRAIAQFCKGVVFCNGMTHGGDGIKIEPFRDHFKTIRAIDSIKPKYNPQQIH